MERQKKLEFEADYFSNFYKENESKSEPSLPNLQILSPGKSLASSGGGDCGWLLPI
jgi:hypothetical protein